MEKIIKTPLGFQTFVWRDNVLARPEDLERAEVIDIRTLAEERQKTSRTQPHEILELSPLQPMWG
jgi:hypothetical protein